MGKYLIKVESMDGGDVLDPRYKNGIECDGFVIMADKGEGATTCLHGVSVSNISDMIQGDSKLMQAAVLANANRQIMEIAGKDEARKKFEALSALFGGSR